MILGDSGEYEFLTEAVRLSAHLDAPTVEIGVRKGFGSKTIMDAILEYCPGKTHIGIDPYGSILYSVREDHEPCRLDYTNDMYKECMADLFGYISGKPVEYVHFKMTDTEYFYQFEKGILLYNLNHQFVESYSSIHFDGPHTAKSVLEEVEFFHKRTPCGATFVFDDVGETDFFYTHSVVHDWLVSNGWSMVKEGVKKALYQKL